MLYIVSTPIGNLEDMTYRAVRVLQEVDAILCEDTRQARKLCQHYDIDTQLWIYHAHSHEKAWNGIKKALGEGKSLALISDAGTPLINDPGILLVQDVIHSGFQISPIPGASSILSGLVASGVSTSEFAFWGFVPHKKGRQTWWKRLADTSHTVVFLESCHRILKALEEMKEWCPEKHVVIGRELTKKFEEFVRGTPEELFDYFQKNISKGEFVVIVGKGKL